MPEVITDNLDLWTSALLIKSTAGRGSNGKLEAYGIKKLRELILELAVRGNLVPQDPSDEAAPELLKRTNAKKKRLIEEGVIRETKPPVFPIESPEYELPTSWVWTNLFELGEIAPRNEAEDTVEASFVPMQAISEKYGLPIHHEVKPWGEIKSGFTHFREEDVVLAKITPCFQNGKSAVMRGLTNGFGAGTTELHVYRAVNACTVPEYVLIYLKSPRFISDGIPKMTGTAGQKRITRDYFAGNYFPLPPLAEQHRIIAKVDELMALCDQLEQQQTHSLAAHQTLVETLLGTLTRVESQQEFRAAWARLASHFDTLFTTEASIDQLKQTILQLAVMGKLVPQNSNDEPASVLLENIAKEKKRLIDEGKINKDKPLPDWAGDELPFNLPRGWSWTKFENIVDITSGITLGRKLAGKKIVTLPYLRVANVQRGFLELDVMKEIELPEDEIDKFTVLERDLLITEGGDWDKVGRTAIWRNELPLVVHQNHVFKARCILKEQNELWLEKYLNSEVARDYFAGSSKQTTNLASINKTQLRRCLVAIPPLAEQHRIVAKVDELMALCDALKACFADAQTTQLHLADAIVEQAVR